MLQKALTEKGLRGIIISPLRRAFLLCPKLAPQAGHGLPEREVHGSFTSVRLQIIFMGGADIMANEVRVKVTLVCTECKQRNYDTMKNKKNNPDRLELKKHCKFCRKHTLHKESK
jgi:large subunit ribosomal protein L33